jgi:hypothetical protein
MNKRIDSDYRCKIFLQVYFRLLETLYDTVSFAVANHSICQQCALQNALLLNPLAVSWWVLKLLRTA